MPSRDSNAQPSSQAICDFVAKQREIFREHEAESLKPSFAAEFERLSEEARNVTFYVPASAGDGNGQYSKGKKREKYMRMRRIRDFACAKSIVLDAIHRAEAKASEEAIAGSDVVYLLHVQFLVLLGTKYIDMHRRRLRVSGVDLTKLTVDIVAEAFGELRSDIEENRLWESQTGEGRDEFRRAVILSAYYIETLNILAKPREKARLKADRRPFEVTLKGYTGNYDPDLDSSFRSLCSMEGTLMAIKFSKGRPIFNVAKKLEGVWMEMMEP